MAKHNIWAGAGALGLALLLSTASIAQDYGMPATPIPRHSRVQAMLNNLGYEAGPNDGLMGPEDARRHSARSQTDAGLPVGLAGSTASFLARLQSTSVPRASGRRRPGATVLRDREISCTSLGLGGRRGRRQSRRSIAECADEVRAVRDLPVSNDLTLATVNHVDRHLLRNDG